MRKAAKINEDFTLDEPLYPVRAMAVFVIVSVGFLYVSSLLENGFDGEALLAGIVALGLILGAATLTGWCTRKYRFRADAEGIRINRPRGRVDQMRWQDMRTAAIVHMDEDESILLSTLEPPDVLVPQRLKARQDDAGTVMRLSVNERNRLLVEHHLQITLPDVCLGKTVLYAKAGAAQKDRKTNKE